jgi:hypothetical protein
VVDHEEEQPPATPVHPGRGDRPPVPTAGDEAGDRADDAAERAAGQPAEAEACAELHEQGDDAGRHVTDRQAPGARRQRPAALTRRSDMPENSSRRV